MEPFMAAATGVVAARFGVAPFFFWRGRFLELCGVVALFDVRVGAMCANDCVANWLGAHVCLNVGGFEAADVAGDVSDIVVRVFVDGFWVWDGPYVAGVVRRAGALVVFLVDDLVVVLGNRVFTIGAL
jgi:hypothetical protein